MSEVRPLAPELREQIFEMLRDETLLMQPFTVAFGDFAIAADTLAPLPRTNAATYQLQHAGAEAGQRAGQPVRVLLRRDSPTKLGQAFKYPHGWRDVVYDLGNAWQTDTEILVGFRMMNGGAGRNRWFGRRDGNIETRTLPAMEQLATRLRQELRQAFAAENPSTDVGLPGQWLTVARLPLAAPNTLPATAETKTLLLRQLCQALVIGETLRGESFDDTAAPGYYLLGAVHKGEDQVDRFVTQGIWENDDRSQYAALVAQVRPGDQVALKSSYAKGPVSILRVKARGTVQATAADGHELRVAWDAPFPAFDLPGLGGYRQTIHQLTKPEDIATIFQPTVLPLMPAHPLNQILYGPPGTGKTYSTTAWALALLNNISVAEVLARYEGDEEGMRQEFERYRQQGQLGFVSFHQSFGYEDFVEGIKPVLNEDEEEDGTGLSYRIEAGIFKRMVEWAVYGLHLQRQSQEQTMGISNVRAIDFDTLFALFVNNLLERLQQSGPGSVVLPSTQKNVVFKEVSPKGALRFYHQNGDSAQNIAFSKNSLAKMYRVFAADPDSPLLNQEIAQVVGGGNLSVARAVFQEFKKFKQQVQVPASTQHDIIGLAEQLRHATEQPQLAASVARDFDFTQLTPADYAAAPRFVLIIDEINRGNVASIFGELISLLEDDKRGRLRVTLPYSKEEFTVPPNLYVLGTMNTADRSVEALDTALRRRFSFHELAPQPQLLKENVEGVNLRALLAALNERLETLLDRDHRLGHAWLLPVKSLDQLCEVFSHKIIPQLQEYFYGHWGRMGQVLGAGFVRRVVATVALMPGFDDGDGAEPQPRYELTPPGDWTAKTFQQLYPQ